MVIHILLVGDPGVGKTALVTALLTEEFAVTPPARAEAVTVSDGGCPGWAASRIVDTCEREQSEEDLRLEVAGADVICLVHRAGNLDDSVSHWLLRLRDLQNGSRLRPVVLVGNQADLLAHDSFPSPDLYAFLEGFPEVEAGVQCSARSLRNIPEVFHAAQKAVLYPISPLYVPELRLLSEPCRQALSRVFKICDFNNDGVLGDPEIVAFQRRCFGTPLPEEKLKELKEAVRRQSLDGIANGGLTLEGFFYIHLLFIQQGFHDSTWVILRKFGYDSALQLKKEYLNPSIRVPNRSTTELSMRGYKFFKTLFRKYDLDKDMCLSPPEVEDMFSICPCVPWGSDMPNAVKTNPEGWITLDGFLSYWVMTTLLKVQKTLKYLAYLGYVVDSDDTQLSAIRVTREQGQLFSRNVVRCQVIASPCVATIAFIQGLLERPRELQREMWERYAPSVYVAGAVDVEGRDKYLVLFAGSTPERYADVVCLLFDRTQPDSFTHVRHTFLKYFSSGRFLMPVMFVGNQGDLPPAMMLPRPEQFCSSHHIVPPLVYTATGPASSRREVFRRMVLTAFYPNLFALRSRTWVYAGLGMGTAVMMTYLLLRTLRLAHSKSPLVLLLLPDYVRFALFGRHRAIRL